MKIKKHRIGTKWVYGEYDFYIGNNLVAEYRTPLIGMDYTYVYFLPSVYGDTDCTRIDCRYITSKDALKKAINLVRKKMYLLATNALSEMKSAEIEF